MKGQIVCKEYPTGEGDSIFLEGEVIWNFWIFVYIRGTRVMYNGEITDNFKDQRMLMITSGLGFFPLEQL